MPASGTSGEDGERTSLAIVSVVAGLAGVATGVIGGAFRWCVARAHDALLDLVDRSKEVPGAGWLVPIVVAAGGAAIARRIAAVTPDASGSGIQEVEAVWRGQHEMPGVRLLPVKFVGALVALGSGLALGREGPTVQMGAVIGSSTAHRVGLPLSDRRVVHVAQAGAGLGVAFNAPFGGAMFTIEEVTKSLRLRIVVPVVVSSVIAVVVSRVIVSGRPVFSVSAVPGPSLGSVGWFVVFGLLTGLLGVGYNAVIVAALELTERWHGIAPVARAAMIGAGVGLMIWIDPLLGGEGDALSQRLLDERLAWTMIGGYLLVRFVVGPLSYATGAPGGLFAPMLAVGALWGSLFHAAVEPWAPGVDADPVPFVIVGMSALFAASVRAPLTGAVLVIEMTAVLSITVAHLVAGFAAVGVAHLLRAPPIYDSLRKRMETTTVSGS